MNKIKEFFALVTRMYQPFLKHFVVIFILLVIGQVLFLVKPYLHGKIIDNIANKSPMQDSFLVVAWLIGISLLTAICGYVRERYEYNHVVFDVDKYINMETFAKLFRLSLGQHINDNSGLRLSVVTKGKSALHDAFRGVVYNMIPFILQIVLTAVALLVTNLILGGVIVVSGLVYLYILFRFNVSFYPKLKKSRDQWNKQSTYYSEIYRNVKLVKMSAKEEETLSTYRNRIDSILPDTKRLWIGALNAEYTQNAFLSTSQAVALCLGVYLVYAGVESPGTIVMLIGWIGSIFGGIGNLGWMQRNLIRNIADINKYDEMLSRQPAVKECDNPVVLEKVKGDIEFTDVSFTYPAMPSLEDDDDVKTHHETKKQEEVLHNVSFSVKAGETVAIVGPSGSGKTTIVNLLLRGYEPDAGEISVDGVPVHNLSHGAYLKTIGYVPQHVELFDDTLRHNLTFTTHSDVSDVELEDVAKKARIDQFFDRLGDTRFETKIGENGLKLSGGERQRVGIARALLQKPSMLIFDEATSSLDAENEALIHDAMREALVGRTGIIIAHRFSTIKDADKIIVVNSGRIVGIGKHEELLLSCEPYQRLFAGQVVMV